MQLFYSANINNDICLLDENESRHCIKVLRMSKGSSLSLVDGKGNLYEGFISDPYPSGCEVTLTKVIRNFEKREYKLHIAISLLKNNERFEWFIEKCVEIGIDEISPLICRNTEKLSLKSDRVNNIIVSAMKQSLKAYLPVLNPVRTFEEFLKTKITGTRMIAHCNKAIERSKIDSVYRRNEDAVILLGPEGDFSETETGLAIKSGFKSVHLGTGRLRTETAGIAACHSVYFINQ